VFQERQHPVHELWHRLMDTHTRLCIDAPVEHGKTTQIDIKRATWELGRNTSHLIALISNSSDIPTRVLRIVRDTLENNPRYRRVFPDLRVRKSTSDEIYLERPGATLKDPSMVGRGVMGAIIGSRVSILILDDILDFQNTWSEGERQKLWELLNSTVLNRVLANGRIWDIGTPWHVEDARHKLRRLPGYTHAHFDAENGRSFMLDGVRQEIPGGNDAGLWSETYQDPISGHVFGFPPERLAEKRSQLPLHEYARQFKCRPLSGAMEIFPASALEYAQSIGRSLYAGGRAFIEEADPTGKVRCTWRPAEDEADVIVTGVDLAIQKRDTANLTAFYTLSPKGGLKHTMEIRAGHLEGPDIIRHMLLILRRYPGHRGFRVENNGAQDYLLQFMRVPEIMKALGATERELQKLVLRPHTTTGQLKADPVLGIRGMSVHFEQGKWPIPCDDRNRCPGLVQDWVDAMLAFDPVSHTNDILVAAWLAAEEARSYGDGGGSTWSRFGMYVPGMNQAAGGGGG